MRPVALLVLLPLVGLALAGCVNLPKDDPVQSASAQLEPPTSAPSANTPQGTAAPKLLAPLSVKVALTGPTWLASGAIVPVTASVTGGTASSFVWATGPMPGSVPVKNETLDTKDIQPGAAKSLKFQTAGVYQVHCHPHPFMTSNVTVIDGYTGPSKVTVKVVDGAKPGEYGFVPDRIVVGVGTEVVYENAGQLVHTATVKGQDPPLRLARLAAQSGGVTVEGEGWMRLYAFAKDASGRAGAGEFHVYVTKELPQNLDESFSGSFPLAPPAAAGLPVQPVEPQKKSVKLELAGLAFLNVTATDATGQGGVVARLVSSSNPDALKTDAGSAAEASGALEAGTYELVVEPAGGANVEFTVTLQVVYDLVPPPFVPMTGGGADPHAGH